MGFDEAGSETGEADNEKEYWTVKRGVDGTSFGPYTVKQLKDFFFEDLIDDDDLARSSTGKIKRVRDIIGVSPSVSAPPPKKLIAQKQTTDEWTPLAIAALVFAIIGLLFFPIVFGTAGIIMGAISWSRGEEKGKVACIVAIVATVLGMILGMIVFAAMFAGI